MITQKILQGLIDSDDFVRTAKPYLKDEYFKDHSEKVIFNLINNYIDKYNKPPNIESIKVDLDNSKDLSEDQHSTISKYVQGMVPGNTDIDWLVDETEKFCQHQAIYNAIMESIQILDGKTKTQKGSIPTLLTDALSVTFDPHIGHDFIEDADSRFEFYHRKEHKLPFNLEYFNKITKGGLSKKTLNICLAGTGVGKSLFMCHVASSFLAQGKNVLYITLEMAEERIAERIDANLLDVTMDDLHAMPKDMYHDRLKKIQDKTNGTLIIKEYPTASAHSGHFRALLNELSLKKSFKPEVVFIDYLNICSSSRFKGGNISSYFYIKAIAEELRGLAVEFDLPIFSATQTTRSGFVSTDIGLEDTSESFGLPATADFMFALMSNDELEQLGQMKIKQLKNRYNDPSMHRSFIVGVDRAKMKLYDVENNAQNIVDKGTETKKEENPYDKFSDFKV